MFIFYSSRVSVPRRTASDGVEPSMQSVTASDNLSAGLNSAIANKTTSRFCYFQKCRTALRRTFVGEIIFADNSDVSVAISTSVDRRLNAVM